MKVNREKKEKNLPEHFHPIIFFLNAIASFVVYKS